MGIVRARVSIGDYLLIASLALAGVVWAVRLEGRVNTTEAAIAARAVVVDQRVDGVEQQQKESIDQVRQDLAYIRARLDQVLDQQRARR